MNVVCTYLLETLLSILFVCFVLFFILLALYPEVELLDQMLILFLIFFFLTKHCIVFCSGCIVSHAHQQCKRVPISPHPRQHLYFLFLFLNSNHPNECEVVSHCGFDLEAFKSLLYCHSVLFDYKRNTDNLIYKQWKI